MATRKPLFQDATEGFSEEMAATDDILLGGLAMSGAITMGTNKITGLAAGTASGDALSHSQSSASLAGLALTADLTMGSNKITGLLNGVADTDAATVLQVEVAKFGLDLKDSCRVATTGPIGAAASLTIGTMTDTVDYTAKDVGTPGNDISVEHIDGGMGFSLTVGVTSPTATTKLITVTFDVGVETAAAIKTALDADADIAKLVDVVAGAGDGVAAASAPLAGGTDFATVAPDTVDSVLLVDTNRVVVKDQGLVAGADDMFKRTNGLYKADDVGTGSDGIWTRTLDADSDAEVTTGLYTFVSEGTDNASKTFAITTKDPITVDTTGITFTQTSALGQILAGTGLTKTADTINVIGGDGIVANANDVAVDLGTDPGLEFVGAKLEVKADTAAGLEKTSSGVGINLEATDPSLAVVSTELGIKFDGTTLQKGAGGTSVKGLPSLFEVNGVATTSATMAADLNTLTDGSDASALHTHLNIAEATRVENTLTTATDTTANGDPVYQNGNDTVGLARADTDVKSRVIGVIRTGAGTAGATPEVVSIGTCAGVLTTATANTPFYLGDAGGLEEFSTLAAGSRVVRVGFAKNADDLWVDIADLGKKAA